jgi:L-ribulose-5-phosphate 4-epimerase
VIKPTGVRYETLSPDKMVVVDERGTVVDGSLKASSDAYAHLYIYRNRPDIGGIVHTHSTFATAFAALGRPIPASLTAICDEFGGPIPCGGYAKVGGDEIGREVVEKLGKSPAVLLKNHGVFTVGPSPEAAVKAAVMVEDAAKTMYFALLLGQPEAIPPEEIERAHQRYLREYGQG